MKKANQDNSSKTVKELIGVVSSLRDPINGCPWDLEQTHYSLIPYILEEAHEVAHAIREDNPTELKEELGDLLLQIVLHAQLAKEKKLFEMSDVIETITKKLIRRHPHVFQTKKKISIEKVKQNWEEIKMKEKPFHSSKSPISDRLKLKIRPHSSTNAALMISKKAAKIGLEWESMDEVWGKLYEELEELKAALERNQLSNSEDELGDVLFTIINIARLKKLSIEDGLAKTNKKFLDRLRYMEENIKGELTMKSKEHLKQYWEKAKTNLTNQKQSQ